MEAIPAKSFNKAPIDDLISLNENPENVFNNETSGALLGDIWILTDVSQGTATQPCPNPTGGTAKGSPLSSVEIDQNFINLKDRIEEAKTEADTDALVLAIALG